MSGHGFLNESNIEVTDVTIPEYETIENVNVFLKTMGQMIPEKNNNERAKVIQALNKRGIEIYGVRNESYAVAKQLKWILKRRNPPKKKLL